MSEWTPEMEEELEALAEDSCEGWAHGEVIELAGLALAEIRRLREMVTTTSRLAIAIADSYGEDGFRAAREIESKLRDTEDV